MPTNLPRSILPSLTSDEPMRLAPRHALARVAVQREARRQFNLTVLVLLAACASLLLLIPH